MMHWLHAILISAGLSGGVNDTLELTEVVITAQSVSNDHVAQSSIDVGQLLANTGHFYIKQYPGGVSTIAFRGMGASHTQVTWEGVRLNSATLGQLDLSLMAPGVFSGVQLLSNGLNQGSLVNSLGGQLQLVERSVATKFAMNFHHTSAAFGQSINTLTLDRKNDHWWTNVALDRTSAQNDFTYENPFNQQRQTQLNSAFERYTVKPSFGYDSDSLSFRLKGWSTWKQQEIPATMLESTSTRSQRDEIHRLVMSYRQNRGRLDWSAMTSANVADQHYHNPQVQLVALNRERNVQALASVTYGIRPLINWKLSGRMEQHWASTDGYDLWQTQYLTTVELAHHRIWKEQSRFFNAAWQIQGVDRAIHPMAGEVIVGGYFMEHIKASARLASAYRHPTLNDLFWQPGGNPNLLPELGQELEWSFSRMGANTTIGLNLYGKLVDNWILWLPTTSGWWSPINVARVWSRGVEIQLESTQKVGSAELEVKSGYSLNYTSNLATSETAVPAGHQLIYSPVHLGSGQLVYHRNQWSIQVDSQLSSRRFITTDNSDYIDPYVLLNARVGWQGVSPNGVINYGIFAQNITNSNYQLVAWRPGLPRHAGVFIKWNYHQL